MQKSGSWSEKELFFIVVKLKQWFKYYFPIEQPSPNYLYSFCSEDKFDKPTEESLFVLLARKNGKYSILDQKYK